MQRIAIHPEIRDGHEGFDREVAARGYVDLDLTDTELLVLRDTIDATAALTDRLKRAPNPMHGDVDIEDYQGLTPVLEKSLTVAMATIARDLHTAFNGAYGQVVRGPMTGDEAADAVRRGTSALRMDFGSGISALTLRPDVARNFYLMSLMIYSVGLPDIIVENIARSIFDDENADSMDAARVIAEARWGSEQIAYRSAMSTLARKLHELEPRWPAIIGPRAN